MASLELLLQVLNLSPECVGLLSVPHYQFSLRSFKGLDHALGSAQFLTGRLQCSTIPLPDVSFNRMLLLLNFEVFGVLLFALSRL